jgi:adenylate kinase family enzyme
MPPNLPDPPCDCNKQNNWTKREDDKEDIISSRIATFYRETAPIIGHYEALGKMLHFTPYRGVEDVNKLTKMVLTYFGWCEDM